MTPVTIVRLLDVGVLGDEALAPFVDWLDASEQQRLARFVRPQRRWQFLAGRILVRRTLGLALGMGAREVRLVECPGAAPALASTSSDKASFSISHSGSWVACAVSVAGRVGLDIEVIDSARDIESLAAQAFDEEQRAWLAGRPPHLRVRDFYSLWSTLEARFKLGVSHATTFDLSLPDLSIVVCCEQEVASPPGIQIDTILA